MVISPPQLTSLVVKSPQSISCPTDHLGTGPRIGGKISCDAYVSSCWRYGIFPYIINAHPALHQMVQTSLWAADLDPLRVQFSHPRRLPNLEAAT